MVVLKVKEVGVGVRKGEAPCLGAVGRSLTRICTFSIHMSSLFIRHALTHLSP